MTDDRQDVGLVGPPTSLRVFLEGGINKVTATGADGTLLVDRLAVSGATGGLASTVYPAEDATTSGSAWKARSLMTRL